MGLYQEVEQELVELDADGEIIDLVLAALEGEDAVERVLEGEGVKAPDATADDGERVPPVYLQDITVSGFRGIGPKAKLEIPPGPGLTVVVGRNGSGKSSFAEGLEVLLTGKSYRWEGKTVVWKKGWRNLHQDDNPKISARFQVEGKNRATVVERSWSSPKLEAGKSSAQHPGEAVSDLQGIGWKEPLDLYRPLLSYKELGIIENSPSSLYDTLSKVLGIGVLAQAMKTLANTRLARERLAKEVDEELKDNILPRLEQLEDPRATRVVEILKDIIDTRLTRKKPAKEVDEKRAISIAIRARSGVRIPAKEIAEETGFRESDDLIDEIRKEEPAKEVVEASAMLVDAREADLADVEAREAYPEEDEQRINLSRIGQRRVLYKKQLMVDAKQIDLLRLEQLEEWILDSQSETTTPYQDLQTLINIKVPNQEQVIEMAEGLNKAYTEWSSLSGTEVENAEHLVKILNLALEHYDAHENKPCPVCGVGILDSSWRTSVEEQIKILKESSQNYRDAKNNLANVIEKVKSLVEPPQWPDTTIIDIDSLVSIWDQWSSLPKNKSDIPEHLLLLYSSVKDEADNVSEQASKMYSEQEKQWSSALSELLPWISKARKAMYGRTEIIDIKQAEENLKTVNEKIRNTRWSPIEEQALEIWKKLRLESNVDLRSVQLTGGRLNRSVALGVEVDNIKTDALSVVSQGEINSMALSIFFPRVMLPASPFRFLVIDDPIQSMDPARVDGLARVFAKVAESRQLIVFTHDNRLPESLRHLDIQHHCLEVRRSVKSKVTIAEKRDPVIQYFFEARSILKDNDIQEDIARRVIPGFCRSGLEAACVEAVWRRWLGKGKKHQAIEQKLFEAKKLSQKASLALFDDVNKGGKVFGKISGKWEKRFAEAFKYTNKGTHNSYSGDLANLINDCHSLAERLRRYDP